MNSQIHNLLTKGVTRIILILSIVLIATSCGSNSKVSEDISNQDIHTDSGISNNIPNTTTSTKITVNKPFIIPNNIKLGVQQYNLTQSGVFGGMEKYYYQSSGNTNNLISLTKLKTNELRGQKLNSLEQFYQVDSEEMNRLLGLIKFMEIKEELKPYRAIIIKNIGVYYSGATQENTYEASYIMPTGVDMVIWHFDSKDYYRLEINPKFYLDEYIEKYNQNYEVAIKQIFSDMKNLADTYRGDLYKVFQ